MKINFTLLCTYFLSLFLFGGSEKLKSFAVSDSLTSTTAAHQFTVNNDQIIAPIQSTMYGIFFEDINFAADGGLYAELVKNRSFEFLEPLMGWEQPTSDRFSLNVNSGFAMPVKYKDDSPNKNYLNVKVNADQGYRLLSRT